MNHKGPMPADSNDPPVLSCVVPCYNEAANIRALHERLCTVMAGRPEAWECICVNNGNRDDTLAILMALATEDPRMHAPRWQAPGI